MIGCFSRNCRQTKSLTIPVRFETFESGMKALLANDLSSGITEGQLGFEDAQYEVGYMFKRPEGDPQDPDNDEDEDDD